VINVKLFAYLRDGIGKEVDVPYVEGMKIADVIKDLKLDPDRVSITIINGKHVDTDTVIKEGDKVKLFPPVGGG